MIDHGMNCKYRAFCVVRVVRQEDGQWLAAGDFEVWGDSHAELEQRAGMSLRDLLAPVGQHKEPGDG